MARRLRQYWLGLYHVENSFDAQETSHVSSRTIQICESTSGNGRKHEDAMHLAVAARVAREVICLPNKISVGQGLYAVGELSGNRRVRHVMLNAQYVKRSAPLQAR